MAAGHVSENALQVLRYKVKWQKLNLNFEG